MIAIDTSSLVAYFQGDAAADVMAIEECLRQNAGVLPPPVLSEILSDPHLPKSLVVLIKKIPLLELSVGLWERTGSLRAKVIGKGLKSRLADALIAQLCIDHDVSLITRDRDFRHYVKLGGLKLF